ncbi:uncharacterized protein KY384_008629 [Bacidia gigantensis]|uniref:uncharacterized protein n=1 Tax=Bacidia gigantensis TaxID=2732470 RepID=UPI001D05B1C5|nr:uncharacterized protein KY384_008629 [Bacidia gigantensis]KAG8527199.1 hypothetical protein KY384_008629 [Bacidia gigantensis]
MLAADWRAEEIAVISALCTDETFFAAAAMESSITEAILGGKTDKAKSLLEKYKSLGPKTAGFDIRQSGVLFTAAESNNLELVKLLLQEFQADVNVERDDDHTVLGAAAYNHNEEMVEICLNYGADINKDENHGSPLQAALTTRPGVDRTLRLLLEHKADVNKEVGYYGNALQTAALLCDVGIVKLLLEHGALVNAQGGVYGNALQAAAGRPHREIFFVLLEAGAKIDAEGGLYGSMLQAAAAGGDEKILECSIASGADVNTRGGYYEFALIAAAYEAQLQSVQFLIAKGANVNAQGGDYGNALQAAVVSFGPVTLEVIKLLLENGADTSIQTWRSNRNSLLHEAVRTLNLDLFNVLLSRADASLLECGIILSCHILPVDTGDWPNSRQIEENGLEIVEQRCGVFWLMFKKDVPQEDDSAEDDSEEDDHPRIRSRVPKRATLQSQAFYHNLEYSGMPEHAIDLLPHLLEKADQIWKSNFDIFRSHLSLQRKEVLRSGGNGPRLIQDLLHNAQLIDLFKDSLEAQFNRLLAFVEEYTSDASIMAHEMPLDQVESRMAVFRASVRTRQAVVDENLKNLTGMIQNLIQLEFNLTSISEAQKSTSTNRSLKRLTWITSLFGMNVDVLKDNPAWWWYPVLAGSTTLITLGVWITFKRNNTLEGNLESKFNFLFRNQARSRDLESAPPKEQEKRHALTKSFSAFGKKRA